MDWIARSDADRSARRWRTAARPYRKALQRQPALPAIRVQTATPSRKPAIYPKPKSPTGAALTLLLRSPDIHLQLGYLKKLQGDNKSAPNSYAKALRLDLFFTEAERQLRARGIEPASDHLVENDNFSPTLAEQVVSYYWCSIPLISATGS